VAVAPRPRSSAAFRWSSAWWAGRSSAWPGVAAAPGTADGAGEARVRHSVFTIEVCARLDVGPQLLDSLRPIVQTAPESMTRDEAWGRPGAGAAVLFRYCDGI